MAREALISEAARKLLALVRAMDGGKLPPSYHSTLQLVDEMLSLAERI